MNVKGAQKHPANLVESTAMATVSLPPPTYQPTLPPEVVTEGRLSEAQIEVVTFRDGNDTQKDPAGRVGFFTYAKPGPRPFSATT